MLLLLLPTSTLALSLLPHFWPSQYRSSDAPSFCMNGTLKPCKQAKPSSRNPPIWPRSLTTSKAKPVPPAHSPETPFDLLDSLPLPPPRKPYYVHNKTTPSWHVLNHQSSHCVKDIYPAFMRWLQRSQINKRQITYFIFLWQCHKDITKSYKLPYKFSNDYSK